jgi:drug/metabolite transporter (DMT)-like permease
MSSGNIRAYAALVIVCIVWGTTYLAIRVGVGSFPPFLFAGIRHSIAGLFIWIGLLLFKRKFVVTWRDLINQAIPGVLMLALGNGVIGWAEQYIPSGLAALIVSVMPVYVVLISLLPGVGGGNLNWKIVLGLLLGCAGVVLIFQDNLGDLVIPEYMLGVVLTFIASFCWAAGTVYMKKHTTNSDTLVNTAIQLSSGGAALLICSPFLDDFSQLQFVAGSSIWALVYLIIFGSLLSYFCYMYAIKNLPVGLVSIYAYVNPFIAILLGFLLMDEPITWITAIAFATTLSGVFWINKGHKINYLQKKTS